MGRLAGLLGIARSLAIYHGQPWRRARMAGLYGAFISPGALCFDVGAHVGSRVRCWRALGARVVAIEPHPDFAALLEHLFGRDSGVMIERSALGARAGHATLFESARHPTVNTLDPGWTEAAGALESFKGVSWSPGPEVAVTTLDALMAVHGTPSFVKIDVEGLEAEVLTGLSRPLAALSFEFLSAMPERALRCLDRLDALGDYEYRWSAGESLRFGMPGWWRSDEIRAWLAAGAARAGGSGDIYARLREHG
ncbi:MAG: FkbM family methyltransferase [Burkholderiaceae bacterium]